MRGDNITNVDCGLAVNREVDDAKERQTNVKLTVTWSDLDVQVATTDALLRNHPPTHAHVSLPQSSSGCGQVFANKAYLTMLLSLQCLSFLQQVHEIEGG